VSGTDTVTMLFTDLVGSTELRGRLGEDAADQLRRRHDGLIADAVTAHGGTVVKGLGDGIMASFASASDGVEAAVAVQQALAAHNRRSPEQTLLVRIGLSAGDVRREDGDCFGPPVVEASRLCAAADGGQILVADLVRLLARQRLSHELRSVGELELKGLGAPLPASEVLWEALPETAQLPLPQPLEEGTRLDFSGREEELEAVLLALKQAVAGERQTVLLAGEPGIGKTRLAREAALTAHAQGATVLFGGCEEELGAPYQPVAQALEWFVAHCPPDQLATRLGRYAGELTRLSPGLATVLPDLPGQLTADPETERYRLYEAVASWLCEAAEPGGLVLVLDDVHWAARPTLTLLQHLLNATARAKLLVVGTYRDTDLDRAHPLSALLADLRRTPGVGRISLGGLNREEVARLVSHAAGHELDEGERAISDAIYAETEGNPFFVRETLRHLRESGTIYLRDGRWVSDVGPSEIGLPEGVREVVGRRLNRLSAEANSALTVGAVVGRDFRLDTVVAVTGLDEDVALSGIDEAVEARLVDEIGVGRYRFAHALVRSTLYDELSVTRRARMHRAVGEYLESARSDDVASLAHHFAAAASGDVTKAVRYAALAGDRAQKQLAYDQAATFYQQALDLLDDTVGVAETGDRQQRCGLLVALGEAQRRSGDPAHRQTLLDASALARSVGATDLLVRAALANNRGFWSVAGEVDHERIDVLKAALDAVGPGDSVERALLLGVLGGELMFDPDAENREEYGREATDIARRLGDTAALADVLVVAGPSKFFPWTIDEGVADVDDLLAITDEATTPVQALWANLWLYVMRSAVGDIERAAEGLANATRLADALGEPILRWVVTSWRATLATVSNDVDEIERLAGEALALGTRCAQPDAATWVAGQMYMAARLRGVAGDLLELVKSEADQYPGLPAWQVVLATVHCYRDQREEAQAILRRFVTPEEVRVPRDVLWIGVVAILLEIAAWLPDPELARPLYEELLPYRRLATHTGVTFLGSSEYYLGMGAAALGRFDAAVEHFEAAVGWHRRFAAPAYLGVTYVELSRALRQRGGPGDAERAEEALAQAQALADETGSAFITRRMAGQLS
jgi:class 3 adenylate cyclase/tetratricopeptide (TPR) repeat protein